MSASDWMKMRTNLWDDPRVGRMADDAGVGEAAIIGALYWLWATADEHSTDGMLAGMTLRQMDRKTGVVGFGNAVASIGWVIESAEGVQLVRFEEHNGQSAKRRASESVRKMSARDADKVQTESGCQAHLELEVEEEKKDQKPDQKILAGKRPRDPKPVTPFDQFWSAYPRKVKKPKAAKVWESKKLDALAAVIVPAVIRHVECNPQWRDPQFIPHPSTWLNAEQWNDEIAEPPPKPESKTMTALRDLEDMKNAAREADRALVYGSDGGRLAAALLPGP